ncbi:3-ketoacyl-ACP reductase [Cognatishimia sp. F0-27]|uniref:3-ketoacyl-ACP reductase n=1 Tax=Cognatishimia sp. F0-27 TaxID=2816855 RepID=UPI001D0CD042|nr:3-ketoacyl-ACP reductase [Cognatishimia sp. F0-27]MCC1492916.1 3-ketoacyl-ACP reductase [Cognatishimia sp. F0-27]
MTPLALITGGQRGIGLGIARALAEQGFAIALASECAPNDPDVVAALSELGGAARFYRHDLRQIEACAGLLDAVEAQQGPVTSFISNAGVAPLKRVDLLDTQAESFDFVMAINLRGGFFLAQEVARRMVRAPSDDPRSMVFITSVSAEMVTTDRSDYCMSKAAGSMMAQLFAARLAADGVSVFEVRPGIIQTAMTAAVREKYDARIADGLIPARRWGFADDVGRMVVPLVTGQMAYATGSVLAVDGGLSIPRL